MPGEIIVKINEDAVSASLAALAVSHGFSVDEHTQTLNLQLWQAPEIMAMSDALAMLNDHPLIDYAEPNYIVQRADISANAIPNDPRFSELYAKNNTGQSGGTADADIDAVEAWDITTGSNVIVGVIDTGVDYNHPDLNDNMWVNAGEIAGNGIDDDNNGFVDDVFGYDFVNDDGDPFDDQSHGTHVAGTIAAEGNNGIGVAGVNWTAQIMALKFLGADGGGTLFDAIQSIEYATLMGADLTNNSWGGGGFSQGLRDAIAAAGNAGQLFVAAAGNETNNNDVNPSYPASYDLENIISVASTTRNDTLSSFSNFGRTTVDLGAPGSDILSTVPGGVYESFSGTSMASPQVAGAAALLLSVEPTLTPAQLKERLMSTVDPVPALAGETVTGGRLNVFNALEDSPAGATLAISATDADRAEGDSGATPFTFTVSRSGDSSGTTSVSYVVTGSGANAATADDFLGGAFPSGTVTLGAGVTTQTVTINVRGDTDFEPDETFEVSLENPSGDARVTVPSATGRIRNDGDGDGGGGDGLVNGSFETGDLTGWRTQDVNTPSIPLAISASGEFLRFNTVAPTDGTNVFAHGFDGNGPGTIRLAQQVTFGEGNAALSFDFITGYDLQGFGAVFDREFEVTVRQTYSGTPLATFDVFTAAAGERETFVSSSSTVFLGDQFANQTLWLSFDWSVPESYTGLADFQLDNIVLATGVTTEDDFAADPSTTGGVAVGGSATGTLEIEGDRDWFAVTLAAGTPFTFDLEGAPTGAGTLQDPFLRLYDSSGALVAQNDDGGSGLNASLAFTAPASGTYFLGAGAFNDESTGSYRVEAIRSGDCGGGDSNTAFSGVGDNPRLFPFAGESVGTRFRADETITVDALGVYDQGGDGLVDFYRVVMFDATGTALAFADIPNGTTTRLEDGSRWIDLDTPIELPGGNDYTIATYRFSDVDPFAYVDLGEFDAASELTVLGAVWSQFNAGDFLTPAFPTQPDIHDANIGANFQIAETDGGGGESTLSIVAISADLAEGSTGTQAFTFDVVRGGDTSGTASVQFSVAGASSNPANAADFGGAFPDGMITFEPGETDVIFTIPVSGDTVFEPDETFAVTLSNPSAGATLGTASATGTIRNDDVEPGDGDQIVSASPSQVEVADGERFTFDVTYTTSPNDPTLTGLGLRMHYDSSEVTFVELTNLFEGKRLPIDPTPQADLQDFDSDPTTDQFVLVAWNDVEQIWPGGTLPVDLYTAVFDANQGASATTIRFTASSTEPGFGFQGNGLSVVPGGGGVTPAVSLDIDDNGVADGNSDGSMILARMFGFSDSSLLPFVGPNASRLTADALGNFLDLAQPAYFDADGNGLIQASSDGNIILAYLLGFPASSLGQFLGAGATRTPEEIAAFLDLFQIMAVGQDGGVPKAIDAQQTEFQVITPSAATVTAAAGEAISFDVAYTTTPVDATLAGLGLRMHFDSSQLEFDSITSLLETSRLPIPPAPQADSGDFDSDPSTDQFVLIAWNDIGQGWPGGSLPTDLYTANFTALSGLSETAVNFTASSTDPGFGFQSGAVAVREGTAGGSTTNLFGILLEGVAAVIFADATITQMIDASGGQVMEIQPGAALTLQGADGANVFVLPGNAGDYEAVRDVAAVTLSGSDGELLTFTARTTAQTLVFDDGALDVRISGGTVLAGSQSITETEAPLTGPLDSVPALPPPPSTAPAQPNLLGIARDDMPAQLIGGGVYAELIDAPGAQTYHLDEAASLTLQGSAGANILTFQLNAAEITIARTGATVLVEGPNGESLSVLAETTPQTLVFLDGAVDVQSLGEAVVAGTQTITESAAALTAPLDPGQNSVGVFDASSLTDLWLG